MSWRDRAACRDEDPELFFPSAGDTAEDAKEVCARCPVRDQCLSRGLAKPLPEGIWAGLNLHERKAIRAARRRQPTAKVA